MSCEGFPIALALLRPKGFPIALWKPSAESLFLLSIELSFHFFEI